MNLFRKIIRWSLALFFSVTILAVILFRFVPVVVTPLMLIRCVEQVGAGETVRMHHHWVSLEKMSPHMPVSVMASEDQRFLLHHGFDFKAIESAAKHNSKGKGRMHGASTITQQTVKNVFLWPGRSWVRKGFEAYFTVLVEIFWSKHRIMEVYLNSIEMGNGIYGVAAVAEDHFGKPASELSRADCALIAATLPNPLKYDSSAPSAYIRGRQTKIMHEMRFVPTFPREGESVDPKTVSGGVYKHV